MWAIFILMFSCILLSPKTVNTVKSKSTDNFSPGFRPLNHYFNNSIALSFLLKTLKSSHLFDQQDKDTKKWNVTKIKSEYQATLSLYLTLAFFYLLKSRYFLKQLIIFCSSLVILLITALLPGYFAKYYLNSASHMWEFAAYSLFSIIVNLISLVMYS